MQLRVLGEVDLLAGGDPVPVGSRNQRAVLAVLAARPGVAAPSDLLVEAVWGDAPPPSALPSLRTYVSRLRRLLGEHLAIGPAGYRLDLPGDGTDAGRFEQLVDLAATVDPAAAVTVLDEALALWRGPPFGDLADLAAVRSTAARLEEQRTAAQEARARALLAAGHPDRAGSAAEQLVTDHPLREGSWAILVEALAATDRAGEALRAYQRAARALAGAGLEPSERLRRAESTALSRREPELAPPPVAPIAGASFVGREADVAALGDLLARHRVVTLVGPGGVGKTRLARAVAAAAGDRHRWGTREVALAGVGRADAVLDVVAGDLGLSVEAGDPARALAQAGHLDLLVVVDNCEHVVEGAARAVEALHRGGSRVRVLATSRQPLGVDGEHLWPVEPLAAGPSGTAAHQLFLDRARAVRPGLAPDAAEEATIDRITRRLDGLPLAIEMAATLVATMPVAELARRLDDQLDLLVSRRRTAEARHRTISAVVAWSEQLLEEEEERRLFADMAVFEGAVRPADAAAVTGHPDPLPVLARLAERSLLVPSTTGRHARFRMLHTVREQAGRTLDGAGRRAGLDRSHAEHVVATLTRADRGLRSPAEPEAHERIEELLEETRAARSWATAHDRPLARRLCGAVFLFAQSRRRDELLGWATALRPDLDPTGDPAGTAQVLLAAAQRDVDRGDLEGAVRLAGRAIDLAADPGVRALAHEVASDVHLFSGRLGEATTHARAGLAAASEAGDAHSLLANRINLALAAAYGGDRRLATELLDGAPGEADLAPSDRAWLAYGRGEVVLDHDPEVALDALDRAIALADSVGNRYVSGVARVSATSLRARSGDAESALASFAAVIEHWRGLGDRTHQLTTLRNLVVLFQRLDAATETAELLGAVSGNAVAPTFGDEAERLARAGTWTARALGRREAELHLAAGARRTVDEAALTTLTRIADLLDRPDRST